MPFDFKKEYKEFYQPKSTPQIVTIPTANYIAVRGEGDPNTVDGPYQQAISVLYAVAYTLKMSSKTSHKIDGFYDYVVPPLEGFWQQTDCTGYDSHRKDAFRWISVLRLPVFITKKDFAWAVSSASQKKRIDCSSAEFLTVDEGLCVQIMHVGSFDTETDSIAKIDAYLAEKGYQTYFSEAHLHHEIYLSDPRKVPLEKRRTVIRQPIRQL